MIRILSTDALAAQIRDIISQAKDHVVLISPFLDEKSDIFNYLHDLRKKSYTVPIFIITRCPNQTLFSKDSHKKAIKKFCDIDRCYVHYCPDLHTKCYFNECDMVITSLNMLSSSEEHNFELGVHINKYDFDGKPFSDALLEVNKICKASIPKMNQINSEGKFIEQTMPAFCIESGEEINYQGEPDGSTKYYIKRSIYKKLRPEQQEENSPHSYCHLCGRSYEEEIPKNSKVFSKKQPLTLSHPFCAQCQSFVETASFNNFKLV